MNYGSCLVCLDIGKEARIRTGQFFDIPGNHMQNETVRSTCTPSLFSNLLFCQISVVNWLLRDRKFHHSEVDLMVCHLS